MSRASCGASLVASGAGGDRAPGPRVRLDNGLLRADVLPARGGQIWELWHLPRKVQWIWQRPGAKFKPLSPRAAYDDVWAGGWEELFPNDAPGRFDGRDLPDHGDWWRRAWNWEAIDEGDGAGVRLWHEGERTSTFCEKRVSLEPAAAKLRIRYRIENRGKSRLRFLFKQHLAVAVTPRHRLELPGGRVTPVDPAFGNRIGAPGPFDWPSALDARNRPVDLSVLPPRRQRRREFVYVEGLPQGWCGVLHEPSGARLRLHFRRETFPYTWLFMTFGGWRGHYAVVLEPCTNMPKDLAAAARAGRCAELAPGAALETEVRAELT